MYNRIICRWVEDMEELPKTLAQGLAYLTYADKDTADCWCRRILGIVLSCCHHFRCHRVFGDLGPGRSEHGMRSAAVGEHVHLAPREGWNNPVGVCLLSQHEYRHEGPLAE